MSKKQLKKIIISNQIKIKLNNIISLTSKNVKHKSINIIFKEYIQCLTSKDQLNILKKLININWKNYTQISILCFELFIQFYMCQLPSNFIKVRYFIFICWIYSILCDLFI